MDQDFAIFCDRDRMSFADEIDMAEKELSDGQAMMTDMPEDPRDGVVAAALLVTTAFRMKDGHGLLTTLRQLASQVAAFEAADAAA